MTRDWDFSLRLFFSADIIDSTGYKARANDAGAGHWSLAIEEFFTTFPAMVEDHARAAAIPGLAPPVDHLEVWKHSGDEILFAVSLHSFHEVLTHLLAMRAAHWQWADTHADALGLRLKLTAWLAGFPVGNSAFRLSEAGESGARFEYIGQGIDIGFRLTRFADERRCPVSADLALMLIDARQATRPAEAYHFDGSDLAMVFDRCERLPGVLGGAPYPLIWVDLARDTQTRLLAELQGRVPDDERLRVYLQSFLGSTPGQRLPFVVGDSDERYGRVDPAVEAERRRLRDASLAWAGGRVPLAEPTAAATAPLPPPEKSAPD